MNFLVRKFRSILNCSYFCVIIFRSEKSLFFIFDDTYNKVFNVILPRRKYLAFSDQQSWEDRSNDTWSFLSAFILLVKKTIRVWKCFYLQLSRLADVTFELNVPHLALKSFIYLFHTTKTTIVVTIISARTYIYFLAKIDAQSLSPYRSSRICMW